jgi:hypothetical protein
MNHFEYEQVCSLCGTPMFSDEPMGTGEVHGTCRVANARGRDQGMREAVEIIRHLCSIPSQQIIYNAFAEAILRQL